jgi:serine/threonine protein kinase
MIVMEYMEGGTLFDFLQQRNGQLLEEEDILRIFIQMLLSLQHVHSKQILHRDLKTQNILLNKSKTIVKIGDFGISKVLSSKSKAYSVVGTPCYISPELCEGKPYNQKSDIWALGCVLYELASLKKAFEAGNLFALISKIMRGNFAPISDQYSSELNKLIVNMLHLDPTKRPQINEIMCNPLVINSYMSYFADLGKVPVSNKVQRSISFSTDSPPATAASKNALQNGASSPGDATAKPSLKQVRSSPRCIGLDGVNLF